jgi:hypothetical protein
MSRLNRARLALLGELGADEAEGQRPSDFNIQRFREGTR